jgi:hypothetical protein
VSGLINTHLQEHIMNLLSKKLLLSAVFVLVGGCAATAPSTDKVYRSDKTLGRVAISTIPLQPDVRLRSATYTPSGKVLLSYYNNQAQDERDISLAVMDDDGSNMHTFFSQTVPPREQDNGIRYMVFPDNQRIFMGDFVLECAPDIDRCDQSKLYPVQYPEQVASGDHISHRWSEMLIAPDNEHVAWTTLFADYSAAMFIGKFVKQDETYNIVAPRVISTLEAFRPDPDHADGSLPNVLRNGEVKQFVKGGTAISLVGAGSGDIADSVVQDLTSDRLWQITHTPGYDETTIFSPDEKLGIVMSSRFSEATDLKLLGMMPKPYAASLNMGLNMHTYTYAVVGVRKARAGNVGPALIDVEASQHQDGYQGINLNTEDEWVYGSPMSWHPSGKKAMWMEGLRGSERTDGQRRIQIVTLLDYEPAASVAAQPMPEQIPYSTDLSALDDFLRQSKDIDVKVYGRVSGHIHYTRSATGAIAKHYVDFSDDGESVYSGYESMQLNPSGNSTYQADIRLTGDKDGVMDLQITFGPLMAELPAELIFSADPSGQPLTRGYAEYDGQRFDVQGLTK